MSEPEPSPDLREDVLDHFSIPQLLEDDDLVLSELIAVRLICHNVSPFLPAIHSPRAKRTGEGWLMRFRSPPKRKKPSRSEMTDWARLLFVLATAIACLLP